MKDRTSSGIQLSLDAARKQNASRLFVYQQGKELLEHVKHCVNLVSSGTLAISHIASTVQSAQCTLPKFTHVDVPHFVGTFLENLKSFVMVFVKILGAVVPNSPGKCTCDDMWIGAACTQMECPNLCSNNGMCVVGECVCHSGFIGTNCSIMECKHGCGVHGRQDNTF